MGAATQAPDLASLEADTEVRIEELQQQRQRLAPEALTHPDAAKRLATVESELASAEQTLERVRLARVEGERREAQAALDAETERRARAMQAARELQRDREAAAAAVDRAAKVLGEKLAAWDKITSRQESALRRAGQPELASAARPRSWMPEIALHKAFIDAGCPHGMIRFDALAGPQATVSPGRRRSLAEADARPVEPAEPIR